MNFLNITWFALGLTMLAIFINAIFFGNERVWGTLAAALGVEFLALAFQYPIEGGKLIAGLYALVFIPCGLFLAFRKNSKK